MKTAKHIPIQEQRESLYRQGFAGRKRNAGEKENIFSFIKHTLMEIVGRITADAKINTLEDGRQVVNFSLAANDTYRKDEQRVKLTQYYRCSYWLTSKVAAYLTKGALVQLTGWASVDAWNDSEGRPRANLNFHTQQIRFHGGGSPAPEPGAATADNDSLPF